ncbi:hypothetical protein EYR41_006778 [Orbilia oligospora]|uniref:Uncharacterized protein n=1 Tax=Orbilia oligospora TaxID=2813651 RepID=A0A8H2HN26_ORBOL|nr:hypothetical protein EYR41_006778 [Orbilia oligospora]
MPKHRMNEASGKSADPTYTLSPGEGGSIAASALSVPRSINHIVDLLAPIEGLHCPDPHSDQGLWYFCFGKIHLDALWKRLN